MAVGEAKQQARNGNKITQVSWTDGTALDVYYGLDHSFQYSRNINCDDELHGIKLSTKATFTSHYAKCQLTSVGDNGVVALNVGGLSKPVWFDETTFLSGGTGSDDDPDPRTNGKVAPGVVFQDYFWFSYTDGNGKTAFCARNIAAHNLSYKCTPQDHRESTDESIEDPAQLGDYMKGTVTAILNYNNTRLVVACGQDIWVYYPELDQSSPVTQTVPTGTAGQTGWKKVLTYEAGVTIVGLTCSFEYLKTWCVDEGWNTKVYYYQGNNNLRNTFVYNLVDLTGVRVTRVYNINGIDYYVSSIDGTDGFVNLYKLVGNTPVQLFKQRAGMDALDVNSKAPYFVGPCGLNAAYYGGKFYIADAYGLFQFTYNPQSFDKGYMKRGMYNNKQVYGVCENKGYLYVSTEDGCYIMRVWDTGKPAVGSEGYQESGILISREFEGKEGGTVTKMLDEVRMNFELNPLTDENGSIDVYVSPNNLRLSTYLLDMGTVADAEHLPDPTGCEPGEYYWVEDEQTYYIVRVVTEIIQGVRTDTNERWNVGNVIPGCKSVAGWFKVMHIDQTNGKTRAEKSNLFNELGAGKTSSFKFDWQTITYAIVIRRGEETRATPIVRQVDLKYHCKDKVDNVYNIN